MKLGRLRSKAEPVSKEHLPSRRLGEPPVLLALAAIMVGVASLALLLVPQLPGDDSPEAGFARDMVAHHTQAVQMADTVRGRTQDPAIRALATDIVLGQQAEIGQMRGWLEVWGVPASGAEPPMTWMGHPTTGPMPGMATPEGLASLYQASGDELDGEFLRLMIVHHQAALPMAEAILERSDRPEVVNLAQKILASQQAEIRGMQALLQRKGFSPVEDSELSLDSNEHASHELAHDLSAALRDTGRLAPLPLALLAAAWLIIDAVRRRRTRAGITGTITPSLLWRMVAVGGLMASAVLHVGLAPTRLAEATSHGIFFAAAGVALAVAAAAILGWPSRPAYAAGVGISIALILLWAIFRVVPPPGAETAEEVDLIGLFTKTTELVAMIGCAVLWFNAHRTERSKYKVARVSS